MHGKRESCFGMPLTRGMCIFSPPACVSLRSVPIGIAEGSRLRQGAMSGALHESPLPQIGLYRPKRLNNFGALATPLTNGLTWLPYSPFRPEANPEKDCS